MKSITRLILAVLCVAALTLAVGGCKAESGASDKPVVYASFFPVQSLVQDIAGDTVEVRSFMPAGKDPHLWELTPKNMKELSKADLLVVNGANMEHWIDQVRDALPNLKVLVLSDYIELITYKGAAAIGDFQYLAQLDRPKGVYGIEFGHTHEDLMRIAFYDNAKNLSGKALVDECKKIMENKGKIVSQKQLIHVESGKVYGIEMGHESGHVDFELPTDGNWVFISDRVSETLLPYDLVDSKGDKLDEKVLLSGSSSGMDKITYDPHSWLSLHNAKKYCNAINDELIKLYPDHEKTYRKNKLKVVDSLTDLESQYREKFKECSHKEFVVTHYAFEYLSREFGLTQFPLQGLTSMEAPSLKTMRKAIDFCNYHKIKTVFYEYGTEKKGADTLAAEIGGDAKPLASMEYVAPPKDGEEHKDYVQFMKMNLENLYESMK